MGRVSTHSRAEAAAMTARNIHKHRAVSTHSRAEAAALTHTQGGNNGNVSTHSRAEAAALFLWLHRYYGRFQHTAARRRLQQPSTTFCSETMFQHTAARRRLQQTAQCNRVLVVFQHTAARRRLLSPQIQLTFQGSVSTHSRAEAAACRS